jgi:hypothetical protein
MAWQYNKKVKVTFVHHVTQHAFAEIDGIGWRRIKSGSSDGVTNLLLALNAAAVNNRTVHVNIDGNNLINTVYLL